MRSSRGLAPGSSSRMRFTETAACEPGRLVVPMNERTFSYFTVGKWLACFAFCSSRNARKL